MPTIFARIVKGEIPCHKVAEDDRFLAFLDINPLAVGHTLVIPKKEKDYIFDLDDDHYQALFLFAKKVALAVENVIPCQRIGIAVVGLEVNLTIRLAFHREKHIKHLKRLTNFTGSWRPWRWTVPP